MNLLNNKALTISLVLSLLLAGVIGYAGTKNSITQNKFGTNLNNFEQIISRKLDGYGKNNLTINLDSYYDVMNVNYFSDQQLPF